MSIDHIPYHRCKIAVLLLAMLIVGCQGTTSSSSERVNPSKTPNFVIIFIDDMGYGDIAPFGSPQNATPHLDQMAAEGMKLTSFYVGSPVCTASRASLLTGCYPQRVGLNTGSEHIVLFPGDRWGLNPNEFTMANMFKQKQYATGIFGKWHLGDQPQFLPTNYGFDTFYGIPYSNDMWPQLDSLTMPYLPLMSGTQVIDTVLTMADQGKLAESLTDKAIDFITENKDRPFFCYLPHAFVHRPRDASEEFKKNATSIEEAQVEEVDHTVGRILKSLKDLKIDDNTFVIFTSDNGPSPGMSAGPLRGRKGSAYEGGHRVPTIVWWPGRIVAGSSSDELMSTIDLLPTFASLTGVSLPEDRVIDGKNVWSILAGEEDAKTPHENFFYQQKGKLAGVRAGAWKYLLSGELYNLDEDLSEINNMAEERLDIVSKMKEMITVFEADISENSREVGKATNVKTILPRPGIEGDEAFEPMYHLFMKKN